MDDELPIVGGPVAIGLANTWYEADAEVLDFLAEPRTARRCCQRVTGGDRVDDVILLRELRDAVRTLVAARSEGRPLEATAVRIVNRHAAAACAHVTMIVDDAGETSARVRYVGPGRVRPRPGATRDVVCRSAHRPPADSAMRGPRMPALLRPGPRQASLLPRGV